MNVKCELEAMMEREAPTSNRDGMISILEAGARLNDVGQARYSNMKDKQKTPLGVST